MLSSSYRDFNTFLMNFLFFSLNFFFSLAFIFLGDTVGFELPFDLCSSFPTYRRLPASFLASISAAIFSASILAASLAVSYSNLAASSAATI